MTNSLKDHPVHGLATSPSEPASFAGRITLPYKLTTGGAASVFLAELAEHRIVGSRCPGCSSVLVPAQDFCAPCAEDVTELVEVPHTGVITAFTETTDGVLALVRLDGADVDLVHRLVGFAPGEMAVGAGVEARWAAEAEGSMLDLEGFGPLSGDVSPAEVRPITPGAEPVLETPYRIDLHYKHAYGPYYGRMFDELATTRRILGVKCHTCDAVLLPPRERCDVCFQRTGEWVDVADTGILKAFSIIHLEFVGQVREPPYVYAEIVLDGASTRLVHTIGGIDVADATRLLEPGMRVRAVWNDERAPTGSLEDILHFIPIESAP